MAWAWDCLGIGVWRYHVTYMTAHAAFLSLFMLKVELVKYPLSMEIVDQLTLFMIYYKIESIDELIRFSDEDLNNMEGFNETLQEAVNLIRGIQYN